MFHTIPCPRHSPASSCHYSNSFFTSSSSPSLLFDLALPLYTTIFHLPSYFFFILDQTLPRHFQVCSPFKNFETHSKKTTLPLLRPLRHLATSPATTDGLPRPCLLFVSCYYTSSSSSSPSVPLSLLLFFRTISLFNFDLFSLSSDFFAFSLSYFLFPFFFFLFACHSLPFPFPN